MLQRRSIQIRKNKERKRKKAGFGNCKTANHLSEKAHEAREKTGELPPGAEKFEARLMHAVEYHPLRYAQRRFSATHCHPQDTDRSSD